jgi:hypothetical protein
LGGKTLKAEMVERAPTLRDWPYYMVRVACDLCPRKGQYRKETLMGRFGADITMPDLRQKIANCPRRDAPGEDCGAYFVNLRRDSE